MHPELRETASETTTQFSFLRRQDTIRASSVWGIRASSVWEAQSGDVTSHGLLNNAATPFQLRAKGHVHPLCKTASNM